jgi:ABC-type maltose transport system permease subunit
MNVLADVIAMIVGCVVILVACDIKNRYVAVAIAYLTGAILTAVFLLGK